MTALVQAVTDRCAVSKPASPQQTHRVCSLVKILSELLAECTTAEAIQPGAQQSCTAHGQAELSDVLQADLGKLPELLKAVTPEEVRHKQVALSHVWRRFLYSDYPLFPLAMKRHKDDGRHASDLDASLWPHPSPPASYHGGFGSDDAFGTILQWLYHRMQERSADGGSSSKSGA